MSTTRKIAVIDFETDPFERGFRVKPFSWGFYDGDVYVDYWGDDAAEQLAIFIMNLPKKHLIYAHNGGKFDFLFLIPYMIDTQPKIINGRIVQWFFEGHELRDSYSILPVPLKASGNKQEFDYKKMHRGVRWRHKAEIMDYLHKDCLALYDMVMGFVENLGSGLTMAGTATRLLKEMTDTSIEKLSLEQDKDIRQFFFGGRVECFTKGIIKTTMEMRDVRSMYPSVMHSNMHPVGNRWIEQNTIDNETDFCIIDATSIGAFPFRTRDGLSFPHGRGIFKITGHEIRAALELRLVVIHRLIRAVSFIRKTTFKEFIEKFTNLRKQATDNKDETGKLHYKLVQNGSYGRFALNPEKLYDWIVTAPGAVCPRDGYELAFAGHDGSFWRKHLDKQSKRKAISNVATGASITGAARAKLLYAINGAVQPFYCDTDAIIARKLNVPEDDGKLGSWQLEANADKIAIAGKKLYALFGDVPESLQEIQKRIKFYGDPTCIKLASKGVRLTAKEIIRVCAGETITWRAETPTMGLDGSQHYIERDIRMRL